MKNKFLALVLVLTMSAAMVGCANNGKDEAAVNEATTGTVEETVETEEETKATKDEKPSAPSDNDEVVVYGPPSDLVDGPEEDVYGPPPEVEE